MTPGNATGWKRPGAKRPRLPSVLERVEQANVVQLLLTLGAAVFVLGTVRKRGDHPGTMMSAGLPDLFAFLPPRSGAPQRRIVFIEVKAADGRVSPSQREFRELAREAGIDHVVGTLDAVIAWLAAEGHLR